MYLNSDLALMSKGKHFPEYIYVYVCFYLKFLQGNEKITYQMKLYLGRITKDK